jgi:hypothetical protein
MRIAHDGALGSAVTSLHLIELGRVPTFGRCIKDQADPVFLYPGDGAIMDGRAIVHDQSKARGYKGGILDVYGGAVWRDVSHDASHH